MELVINIKQTDAPIPILLFSLKHVCPLYILWQETMENKH